MVFHNALVISTTLLVVFSPLLFWPYWLTREDKTKIRALCQTRSRIIPSAVEIPLAYMLTFISFYVSNKWAGGSLIVLVSLLMQARVRRKWWEVTQIKPKRIWPPMWVYINFGMRIKQSAGEDNQ